MQGSYKNNGLPRPYYMKPQSKRKHSPYDNMKMPVAFFTSSPRKILGYLILLSLFGTCVYWISQDMRPSPPPSYEIIKPETIKATVQVPADNLEKIANAVGSKADKEALNIDLAENLAAGSKGQKGIGVAEAPKGGIANEAAVVGSDEDKIIGTGKKSRLQQQAGANGGQKGYKASKEGEVQKPQAIKEVDGAGIPAAKAKAAVEDVEEDDVTEEDIAEEDVDIAEEKAKDILDETV